MATNYEHQQALPGISTHKYLTTGAVSIFKLFKGLHTNCHPSSHCRAEYRPRKQIFTDPQAVGALENTLRRVNNYRYAESYCRVC